MSIDIDKLEALERAATPAPWVYDDGIEQDEQTQQRVRPETVGPFGADAARTDDCIFLAELRNAAPALIAEVRRLRAIEAAARAWMEAYLGGTDGHTQFWAKWCLFRSELAAKETP